MSPKPAAGPLAAVFMVGTLGLRGLWVAVVPAVAVSGVLLLVLPRGSGDRPSRPPPPPLRIVRHLRGPLGLVFGISALGAFVQRLFVTLEPIIVAGCLAMAILALHPGLRRHREPVVDDGEPSGPGVR